MEGIIILDSRRTAARPAADEEKRKEREKRGARPKRKD